MGTNYYLKRDVCPHCKREGVKWHIGKSSAGWVFGLHVDPEQGINDLDDLVKAWEAPDCVIEDEYGNVLSKVQMLDIITKRDGGIQKTIPYGYPSWTDFFSVNHAQMGPNNLLRSNIGIHCVKHGEGTWDCHPGEFS